MLRAWLWILLLGVAPASAAAAADEAAALVATARLEASVQVITLPPVVGLLRAAQERVLSAEVPGRVESIALPGQRVRAGETIVALSTGLERARLRQAEAQVANARAAFQRAREMRGSRAVSQKELDDAATQLELRRADRDVAREQLARRFIAAPFDGLLIDPVYEAGEVIAAGAPIATLIQLDPLELELGVAAFRIGQVEAGAAVQVSVPALEGETFAAVVSRVAPAAAPGSHLFEVEVRVPNGDERLRPGMSARARIVTATLRDAIAVPNHLVVERAGEQVVFFVANGIARAVSVADARVHADRLLLPGSIPYREVVMMGHRDLRDGQRVRVDNAVLAEVGAR